MGRKVVIVGAGMLGAQTAYRLQEAGGDVTIVDTAGSGGVATASSFGWINASFHLDAHHFAVRREGMAAWRRLLADIDLPVARCGALSWEHQGPVLDGEIASLTAGGYAVEAVGPDRFAALAPCVGDPPERALWFPDEMAAESAQVAAQLLQAAVNKGACFASGVSVTGVIQKAGAVTGVETNAGDIFADHVLLCAGVQTDALVRPMGLATPMARRPALMLRTRPIAPCLDVVLVTPVGEIRQLPDGSLLMPAAIGHQGAADDSVAGTLEEAAEDALARLQRILPGMPLEIGELMLAHRPFPQDGLPIVGQMANGLSVAVMHSGITLGALMGELVASEILNGPSNATSDWLAPYRPERFFSAP